MGEGNVTIADDQASGEDSTERLNRDTDNTTKDLYSIDRQQGNVDLTIDTRLLTEDGRDQIAQDFKDTNEFGQDIGRAIETVSTEEAVKLVHFWKTLENNINVTALKKIIRSNETLKAQLVSGNAEDLQAGTQQLIALAQGQLGLSPEEVSALFFYDASTVAAGSLADNNPFQDVKGATVLEGQYQGDIFVDVSQSVTDGDILNTVGQEAYEGATLANGEANDATQEALSEAYGTQFTTRIGEAIKESGGGDVNTSYNTVNTLQGSNIVVTGSTRATAVGNAAVDYRQVHRIEHGKISEMAANLSEKTGKDKAYWEDRLTSQLERRVNYEKKMDGIEEKSWDRESDNLLKSFINGNGDQFIVDEQGEYVLDPYGEKVPLFGNAANYQLENDTIFNDSAESNGEMPKLGWQEFKDYTASNISSTATNVASVPKDAVVGLYNLFTTNPLVTYEAMVEAVKNLPESQRQKALDFYTASVEHDYQKLGELQGEINSLAVAEVIAASIPGATLRYLDGKPPRVNILKADEIRFSQNTVSYNKKNRITGEKYTYDDLVGSMKKDGWKGDAVDVVKMPDGKVTSMDNTRIRAAREAGIDVKANVRDFNDPLTPEIKAARGWEEYNTWGEAITGRINKQSGGFSDHNSAGSLNDPKLTGKKK